MASMNTKITPAMVALAAVLVAAITILLALGKDPALLISFINTAGLILLYGDTQTIKTQTNGTNHRLMNIVEATTAGGTAYGEGTAAAGTKVPDVQR